MEFDIKLSYSGVSNQPDSYEILYTVFDSDGTKVFTPDSVTLLNQAGQSFQRTSVEDMAKHLNLN